MSYRDAISLAVLAVFRALASVDALADSVQGGTLWRVRLWAASCLWELS